MHPPGDLGSGATRPKAPPQQFHPNQSCSHHQHRTRRALPNVARIPQPLSHLIPPPVAAEPVVAAAGSPRPHRSSCWALRCTCTRSWCRPRSPQGSRGARGSRARGTASPHRDGEFIRGGAFPQTSRQWCSASCSTGVTFPSHS